MILSENDKRELCPVHGWVGRRAFQQDRHDLCEAPVETTADDSDDDTPVEDQPSIEDDIGDHVDAAEMTVEEDDVKPLQNGRRSARRRGVPAKKTVAVRRITQLDLQAGRAELRVLGADDPYDRPQTRNDCRWCLVCQAARDGKRPEVDATELLSCGHRLAEVVFRSRPCVFIACKHALFLDTSETGSIILNFPHLEPGELPAKQSCSLDLADRGGMTLEEIAVVTNLTRERIRQVELKALIRRARPAALALGLGAEDAASVGTRHHVGPGADLTEAGIDGEVPSDIATILSGGRG